MDGETRQGKKDEDKCWMWKKAEKKEKDENQGRIGKDQQERMKIKGRWGIQDRIWIGMRTE